MFLVGMGLGGVMLTFLLTCTLSARTLIMLLGLGMGMGGVIITVNNVRVNLQLSAHYIVHVAWVGYGDG